MKYVTVVSTNPLIVAPLHEHVRKLGYKMLIIAEGKRLAPLLLSASLRRVVCLDVTLPLPTLTELVQIFSKEKTRLQGVDVILILPEENTLPQAMVHSLQQLTLPLFDFPRQIAALVDMIEILSVQYADNENP